MPQVRPATEADLPIIYDIWYETEVVGVAEPPPPGGNPWFASVLSGGRMVVAVGYGGVVGFAGVRHEGPLAVLTDCFVRPPMQSTGVGRAMLDAVLPATGPRATFASGDARAVASYARRGLVPRWPAYYLTADRGAVAAGGPRPSVLPAGPAALDMLVQPHTNAPWCEALGAASLEVRDGDDLLGAAVVAVRSPFRLHRPDTATVLESVAQPGAAADVLTAVVSWALARGAPAVALQVPGPHEALAFLLGAGFRIADADTACATDPAVVADPATTTFYGEILPPPAAVARRAPAPAARF